jgi:phosphoserine aminotransferase
MLSNSLNFSGGPGALPLPVLEQTHAAVMALPETGLSVLGMSHRSDWFKAVLAEAEQNLRALLRVPDHYSVIFLQGGSSLQFSMIPMNFAAGASTPAEFVVTGYWSGKAVDEAATVAPARAVWDGADVGYTRLPAFAELARSTDAPFFHYVSNETVEGLQFNEVPPSLGVPLIADMSSDFLSRQVDVGRYAMIYAHAQKNLGPAGVTVALIDNAMLARIPNGLPAMLDYRTHIEHHSNYNTPPVFSIYVLNLVTRWLLHEIGGVDAMQRINARKAAMLYGTLDALAGVAEVHAQPQARSQMNVAFHFIDRRLDAVCLAAAAAEGFTGLEGHRSLGGLRASIYNAVTEEAVAALSSFLSDFARRHG